MKRAFLKSMLLTLACIAAMRGAALAQPGEPPGPGGEDHAGYGPPPMGGGFGGPMMGPMGPGGGFGRGGGPRGAALHRLSPEDLERAGVTEAQRTKIEDLRDESMRRRIQDEASLRIAELDLRKMLDADRPDTNAVGAAVDRIGDMRTALWKAQVHEMLAVRAILTPEQRAKLREGRTANGEGKSSTGRH